MMFLSGCCCRCRIILNPYHFNDIIAYRNVVVNHLYCWGVGYALFSEVQLSSSHQGFLSSRLETAGALCEPVAQCCEMVTCHRCDAGTSGSRAEPRLLCRELTERFKHATTSTLFDQLPPCFMNGSITGSREMSTVFLLRDTTSPTTLLWYSSRSFAGACFAQIARVKRLSAD